MDTKKPFGFYEVALHKQETATSIEEAVRALKYTCGRCNRAGWCNESRCPVVQAHEARKRYLEFLAFSATQGHSQGIKIIHTRKYDIDPEKRCKQLSLKMLNRCYEKANRRLEIALDNASVQLELGDYNNVVIILKKAKLDPVAERIESYVDKYIRR